MNDECEKWWIKIKQKKNLRFSSPWMNNTKQNYRHEGGDNEMMGTFVEDGAKEVFGSRKISGQRAVIEI